MGTFPAAWKHAIVTPLSKKGDPKEIGNYRPVSLLPVFSKVIEKIVANQLFQYTEHNSLLSSTHHGFRPKLSPETTLLQASKKIYDAIDNRELCFLTLCDLSKPFDSVSHDSLLKKCTKLWIDNFWLKNYLCNRTQYVGMGNDMSSALQVHYWVPQGSVLEPIVLINIYVNDLSNEVKDCFLIQYADDTQCLQTGTIDSLPQLIHNTKQTLTKIKHYFSKSGLLLNSMKTQCIFIGSRALISKIPGNTIISPGEASIHPSRSVKNLGLHFDHYMSFDVLMTKMSKKVSGTLMYINRIQDLLSKEARLTAVETLALSHINYGITIWSTTNIMQLKRVQNLENFAAKVTIGGASKFDHATPILNKLQFLSTRQKVIYEQCLTSFKIMNNRLPSWI